MDLLGLAMSSLSTTFILASFVNAVLNEGNAPKVYLASSTFKHMHYLYQLLMT